MGESESDNTLLCSIRDIGRMQRERERECVSERESHPTEDVE